MHLAHAAAGLGQQPFHGLGVRSLGLQAEVALQVFNPPVRITPAQGEEAAAEWNEALKLDPKGPWGREAVKLLKERKP